MTPATHDLMLRVAEAVRSAAATAALGTAHNDARGGRNDAAQYQQGSASAVRRVDIAAIVAQIAEQVPDISETDAFAKAAREALFGAERRPDGTFLHPITQRAYDLWQAAVRWARLNPVDRSPAPQQKAGEGAAAD